MAMNFEELDGTTRRYMLQELEAELASGNPYFGKNLSVAGRAAFPELMMAAINRGNEETLGDTLNRPSLWKEKETYMLKGVSRQRRINVRQHSERLALTEFNTWYVRGLARRLMDEGEEHCQRNLPTTLRHFPIQFSEPSFPPLAGSAPSAAVTGSARLIQTSTGSSAALGGPPTKRSGRAA